MRLESADLHFRGFSEYFSPVTFDYERVLPVSMWNPTPGNYTRYGDVRDLMLRADDRMVVMGSGDEASLLFDAAVLPPVAAGWKRDFLLLVDGWAKDADANTAFSQTVLPLPYHGQKSYDTPPTRLEDDPVYRRFPADWRKFHTRYVTPAGFERGLRPPRREP